MIPDSLAALNSHIWQSRLEVESSGHTWLDVCNFQWKRLLPLTEYRQRHPVRIEDYAAADENIEDAGH